MKKFSRSLAAAILSVGALSSAVALATDWPLYRGPSGDGIVTEPANLPWGKSGPKVIWKAPTPNGFSSFTVADGEAFTQISMASNGQDHEACVALNAATGKRLWATDVGLAIYKEKGGDSGTPDNRGGDGPRSTPVVSDGMVYVNSSDLVVYALDAKTGKMAWKADLVREYGGKPPSWRNAASPLIDGDRLYVGAGGKGESFLALNKKTGAVIWKTGTEKITHATPILGTILGQKQVIFFVQKGLVALDPESGKELWTYPFKYSTSTAASPVICGDIVYCSAGYGVGAGACKITKNGSEYTATQIMRVPGSNLIANHWSTPVYKDGYLYGMFSFKRFGVGAMKCVEVATGDIKWEHPNFGAGNVILVNDKLLALADDGELVVVEADPSAYKELSRTKAINGKCWSTPAISDNRVYVRSTKEGACLDLGK